MNGYKKFKAYMAEHGIKQKDIVDLLNVSASKVNQAINGTGNCDFTGQEIKKICETYDISADIFLS